MGHIDSCSLFKAEITFIVVCFSNAYRIILSLHWHISMEAHVVSLILSIRNCATDPYARLSASSSRVLWIQWLVVVLSQEDQLLVHIKRNHSYRTISEMLDFSFISAINQSGNFTWLNMTRCHCVVVK